MRTALNLELERLLKRPPKYGAKRTTLDGYRFDSIGESKRYAELKLLELAKNISGLKVHESFPLEVNGERVCTYVADFSYFDSHGTHHVEDWKGVRTALFVLKKKLMKACLGIEIEEIRRRARHRGTIRVS